MGILSAFTPEGRLERPKRSFPCFNFGHFYDSLCCGNKKEKAEHLDKLFLALDTNGKKNVRVDENEVVLAEGGQLMRSEHSCQLCLASH